MSEDRMEAFLDEFRDTDPAVLDDAFRKARGVCKEFPTPADVREFVKSAEAFQRLQEYAAPKQKALLAGPTVRELKSAEAFDFRAMLAGAFPEDPAKEARRRANIEKKAGEA